MTFYEKDGIYLPAVRELPFVRSKEVVLDPEYFFSHKNYKTDFIYGRCGRAMVGSVVVVIYYAVVLWLGLWLSYIVRSCYGWVYGCSHIFCGRAMVGSVVVVRL